MVNWDQLLENMSSVGEQQRATNKTTSDNMSNVNLIYTNVTISREDVRIIIKESFEGEVVFYDELYNDIYKSQVIEQDPLSF